MDDAHRPRIDPDRGEANMGMDYFLARATDPQHAKAVLNCLDVQSGAVISAMVVKGGDPYALAATLEAIKFTGRTRLIIMSDQENAVKNLVDMIRHETAVINTELTKTSMWMRTRWSFWRRCLTTRGMDSAGHRLGQEVLRSHEWNLLDT